MCRLVHVNMYIYIPERVLCAGMFPLLFAVWSHPLILYQQNIVFSLPLFFVSFRALFTGEQRVRRKGGHVISSLPFGDTSQNIVSLFVGEKSSTKKKDERLLTMFKEESYLSSVFFYKKYFY